MKSGHIGEPLQLGVIIGILQARYALPYQPLFQLVAWCKSNAHMLLLSVGLALCAVTVFHAMSICITFCTVHNAVLVWFEKCNTAFCTLYVVRMWQS